MNCIPWLKGKLKKKNTEKGFIKIKPEPLIVFSITDSDDDQENQDEGVESLQKTYAVETNEILQQIEKKWEPVFNRPEEASF